MRFLVGVVCNSLGLLATTIVPGIHFNGNLLQLLLAGAILGVFNFFVRPLAIFISIPLLVLTLGIFYFVLNGILLWLAAKLIPGYSVSGIFAGMLGSLVLGLANWALEALFKRD
jgi:putative membrane protein